MNKFFRLSTLLLVLSLVGCSLPGEDLTSSPDETDRELKNANYLKSIYNPIRGFYSLQQQDTISGNSRCVIMQVDYDEVEKGKTTWGEPIMMPNLWVKYTDVYGLIVAEKMFGRYYKDQRENFSFRTTSTSGRMLSVSGSLLRGEFKGEVRADGYAGGFLNAQVTSSAGCPGVKEYRKNYQTHLMDLFAGEWEGTTEATPSMAPFPVHMSIEFLVDETTNEFISLIPKVTFLRGPYGSFVPFSTNLTLGFNQKPITVKFYLKFYTQDLDFNGRLTGENEIIGTLSEVTGPKKLKMIRIKR